MFSAKLIAFVAALMAQEAVALNAHRHAHNAFHGKRAVVYVNDVVTVTDWTTVTVYDDGAPASTTTPKMIYKGTHTDASSTSASAGFSSSANSTSSTATSSSYSTSSSSSSSSTLYTSSSPLYTSSSIYTPTTLATSTKVSSSYPIAATSSSAAAHADAVVLGFDTASSSSSAAAYVATTSAAAVTTAVAVVATTSSSAAAAAITTASSSSSSSGKRGLAYNDGSLLSPFLSSGTKCSWSYNWGQTAASEASSDVEFIPMLWSPTYASTWADAADSAISSGATALLSFNECDNAGQCNLDAASAAAAHITHMAPYSGKAKIGAPAITNSGSSGEGIEWLTSFLEACNGECAIDFCPLHWYNSPDADEFLQHVEKVHAACGKPVWITEFAPISGSDSDIATFLETVMTALDSDTYSYVERYSYFMAATGSMLTSSTSLSTFGKTFAYY